MSAAFDVIGDVHGSVAMLEGLLGKLGYRRAGRDRPWHHPDRQAVFVGDLIDRGPAQRRTIELVRAMVDAGSALITLGNHEFNAIAYATPDDERGGHLRERNRRHFRQHHEFLTEYPVDGHDHGEVIDWFRSLPMWLELPGLRVVHACWSDDHIETLRAATGGNGVPDGEALVNAARKPKPATAHARAEPAHPLYDAVEVVLKGPEVPLPKHLWYRDKDGNVRREARLDWWSDGADTLRDRAVFIPGSLDADGDEHPGYDDTPLPAGTPPPYASDTPVVVGHYWRQGTPSVLSNRCVCVDYSAVKGGQLVAYRFDGEPDLTTDKLVAFP